MDPRCVRVRDLVCTDEYVSAANYDSNPSEYPSGSPYTNLKMMCDHMSNIQGVDTEKCMCQDWSVSTVRCVFTSYHFVTRNQLTHFCQYPDPLVSLTLEKHKPN